MDMELQAEQRSQWVTQRLNELPHFVMFLYNLLLDANIEWRFKHHAFAVLRYLFDEVEAIIPDDDPILGRLDDLCMVYRCFAELIGTMSPAKLARYEEVLHREGISIRNDLPDAARMLGKFYFAVAALYPPKVENLALLAGNSIKTGQLVRKLQHYVNTHKRERWSSERMQRVEVFLKSYTGGKAMPPVPSNPSKT